MLTTAIISLRETFETSLILCVLLAYLARKGEERAALWIWVGTGIGVIWSIAMAIGLTMFSTSISGEFEEIYEGIMMVTAAGLLSWTILWMASHGRSMKKSLENKMADHISKGYIFGIAMTSFVATAREGTELVLLTHAALLSSASPMLSLVGSGIGIALAIGLAWILFKGTRRLPIGAFFTVTSGILLVIALLLLRHGIHEFMEAGVLIESDLLQLSLLAVFGLGLGGMWLRMMRAV